MAAAMAKTRDDLFARFTELGIETTTHRHPPLFTVEDSKRLRGDLPGGHCKSLFLKDKKGQLFLVVALEDRSVDLKRLRKAIGAATLSFGKPELMMEVLGIAPGSVTPFALINDGEARVRVVLDQAMLDHDPLNYHPLTNGMTTAISPADLLAFIAATGRRAQVVDMDGLDPDH